MLESTSRCVLVTRDLASFYSLSNLSRSTAHLHCECVCMLVFRSLSLHVNHFWLFTWLVLASAGVNRITYWSQGVASLPHKCQPPPPSDRQHPSYGDCLEVKKEYCQNCSVLGCEKHSVHSQQHTYVSSSYRSNRFGLSHWDLYAMRRGSCPELYYCNTVEWCWWDSSLIWNSNWFPSVLWHCWFGHMTLKIVLDMTYNVFLRMLNLAQSITRKCVMMPTCAVIENTWWACCRWSV